MPLKTIHAVTGICLGIFVALHLFNHLGSIWGASHHVMLMNQLRPYYRNSTIEVLLLICALIVMLTGLKLFLARDKKVSSIFWNLQLWSGIYLLLFLIIH
jgi:hypothetical protein